MNAVKKNREQTADVYLEELAAIERDLSHLDAAGLWKEFKSGLQSVSKHTARMAVCIKLLRDLGESLVGVPNAQMWIRIAEGRVLPELITTFAGSPSRHILERLPIADQRRLVKDPMIEVAQKTENGYTKQRIDVTLAPVKVVEQAVDYAGLRSVEEQVSIVALQSVKPIAPKPTEEELDEPLVHSITSRYTAAEYKRIRLCVAETGESLPEFVRKAANRAAASKRKRERV